MLSQVKERHEDVEWMLYLNQRVNELYNNSRRTFAEDHCKFMSWWYRIHLLTTILAATEKAFSTKKVKNVEEAIKQKPLQGLNVLEVGFGGEVASEDRPHYLELAQLGAKTFGLEPGTRSAKMAKDRCKDEKAKITGLDGEILLSPSQMKEGIIENLPEIFPNQKFDVVCSSTVFAKNPLAGSPERFEEKVWEEVSREWMAKIATVLKPGGLSVHTNMDDYYFPKSVAIEKMGYRILALNRQIEKIDTRFHVGGAGGADYYSVFMKK